MLVEFGAEVVASYDGNQQQLESLLEKSYAIIEYEIKLETHKSGDSLLSMAELLIPCFLHLKKNTAEPLITFWMNDVLEPNIRRDLTSKAARHRVIATVVELINKKGMKKDGKFLVLAGAVHRQRARRPRLNEYMAISAGSRSCWP